MKTLQNPVDKAELLVRLQSISPASTRRWGKMSAHEMICHLADAFRLYMGLTVASAVPIAYPRILLRWAALRAPIPWPRGFRTAPEMDQEAGGTRPALFERDTGELRALMDRFTQAKDFQWPQAHPHLGPMSPEEWMRLAYLHTDHHLRQFGA